ncbi:MAG: hypothetical protein WAT39_22940 [Planctomycetota bacterium]
MKILLLVAVLSPLLALWPTFQDAATDWGKEVERACTSPRYGLRLAAARKVAAAGPAAMPAIVAWADKNGVNGLPSALIDAIADETHLEAVVWEQLIAWSRNRDFYWRAAALRGVALRAPRLTGQAVADALRALFVEFRDDPAWLMRTHARFGLALTGDDTVLALPEADPRARARLPLLLLQAGKVPALQPLLDALADERTFQEVPWAQQTAAEVHRVLKAWLGDAHPLAAGGSFADTATGLAALRAACEKKSGQTLALPAVRRDATTPFTGGIELLSCKHGDQFLQWTDAGELAFGIDAATSLALPASTWDRLSQERTALALADAHGVVVCDSIRLRWTTPKVHSKAAPASLPAPAADWLKRLAAAIEEAGSGSTAANLRAGIEQFTAR